MKFKFYHYIIEIDFNLACICVYLSKDGTLFTTRSFKRNSCKNFCEVFTELLFSLDEGYDFDLMPFNDECNFYDCR